MAALVTKFNDFIRDIRPTQGQGEDMRDGHKRLRNRLHEFADLQEILVADFLQGSYKRATAIRPAAGHRSDVDIVVVTNLPRPEDDPQGGLTPAEALARFEPFVDHYYKGKWRRQGRSIGIELSYVDLDLVITAKPADQDVAAYQSAAAKSLDGLDEDQDWWLSPTWVTRSERGDQESAAAASADNEWKTSPLWIPDRDADEWDQTHPLDQIQAGRDKNLATSGRYLGVVKCIKWWQRQRSVDIPKPKGYPLEHLVWLHCPDDLESHADGVTRTFEAIAALYAAYVAAGTKPVLPDHGVPEHDVLAGVSVVEFADFHEAVCTAAETARAALAEEDSDASAALWRELFGAPFPGPTSPKGQGGFTPPVAAAQVSKPGRYA